MLTSRQTSTTTTSTTTVGNRPTLKDPSLPFSGRSLELIARGIDIPPAPSITQVGLRNDDLARLEH